MGVLGNLGIIKLSGEGIKMAMKNIAGEVQTGEGFSIAFYNKLCYQIEAEFNILVYTRIEDGVQLYIDEADWNNNGLIIEGYCKGYVDNETFKEID